MRRLKGFTLLELVIVITITGIIAGVVAVFFKPAIDSYFDSRRRARLTDMADTALRRMAREVRVALPNSIRTPGPLCFEVLPTSSGGRYRMAADTVTAGSDSLDTTGMDNRFDVLSPLATAPAVGDWVVIGNQSTNDVYQGTNRGAIASYVAPHPVSAGLGTGRMTLAAATQFPAGYDGGRFFVVPNRGGVPATFFICDGVGLAGGNGTGTLRRLTRAFTPAYPGACPAGVGDVMATRVAACHFSYAPNQGATQQSGFVWMEIQLVEGGETVDLSYGVHVSNVP
jgi:MSHA biogenesis protein MshO